MPAPNPPRIIVKFQVKNNPLKALIDTGSELNLISERAVAVNGLIKSLSDKPIRIQLALQSKSNSPILLQHFTTATLTDPHSCTVFDDVRFTIGPIAGDYDVILGTPFLTTFDRWMHFQPRIPTVQWKQHFSRTSPMSFRLTSQRYRMDLMTLVTSPTFTSLKRHSRRHLWSGTALFLPTLTQ
ncbi:hypothetical protein PSTG_04330 [Puccinia striiformis f. sp. tritici PST-78]|uniref:Peptidase A2 domain-containing protein n=1 Tax=Puccinia striiformis f. sp. tritici PST-78 TaxID=1165861 RepID=A0A0L0VT20_9BASI|nr:hypothetical protein PSTG_04330 [Puccinia striiformis f. sp. tritici PST-78]